MLHCRMMVGGEHKTDADIVYAFGDGGRVINPTACQALPVCQNCRRCWKPPDCRAWRRLHRRRRATKAAAVEMLKVPIAIAAGAAHIIAFLSEIGGNGVALMRKARAAADNSSGVSPLIFIAVKKAAVLCHCPLAA